MCIRDSWYASHAERYSEEQRYQLLKYVDNRAVKGGNLVIDGHGMENIPKENGLDVYKRQDMKRLSDI